MKAGQREHQLPLPLAKPGTISPQAMPGFIMSNIFVASSNGDPMTTLVMSGDTMQQAAAEPDAIGRVMVDQAYAEGHEDLTGCSIYYERNTNSKRMLERYETGMEDLLTGGWVRVITPPKQALQEQKPLQTMVNHGDATCHGVYRGVRLIEFHVSKADLTVRRQSKGFA